jgi:hypothetical protein
MCCEELGEHQAAEQLGEDPDRQKVAAAARHPA